MPAKRVLYIVRHAKSTWDYENVSDIDRPLKLRGIKNAYEMARRLKIDHNIPDFFISSPANRALHTACIFLTVFEASFEKMKIEAGFYGKGTEDILTIIKQQPAIIRKLMIFGHNPDFSELARAFSKQPLFELPTCGIAAYTFDCAEWSDIDCNNLKSEMFDFPKNL
jgi:phosphohistidine phosphatase